MADRVLITGGAGFIGNHIARLLLTDGWEVICYDDLSVGKTEYVPDGARLIVGDIRDEEKLTVAMYDCRHVYHLAARVSIRKAVDTFIDDAEVNTQGTLIAFRAAHNAGAERFFYSSSMAVYGEVHYSPQDEQHPINPTSPYGIAKYASERYLIAMGKQWDIKPVICRYFNTYGPRQTPSPYVGVITIFCNKLFAGESPVIFGDGEQLRDFIHVDDIARGSVMALQNAPAGSVLNLGTGIGTSVNEIARILIERTNPAIKPEHVPPVPGEPGDSIADWSLAESTIGWKPSKKLETAINDAIEWNRSRYELNH
jgi:UDP-glucose 4-epimerase